MPTVKMELRFCRNQAPGTRQATSEIPQMLVFPRRMGGLQKCLRARVTLLGEEMVSKVQNSLLSAGKVARRIQENLAIFGQKRQKMPRKIAGPKIDYTVYIYIYIYMAVTSLGGPKKGKNLKKCPVL